MLSAFRDHFNRFQKVFKVIDSTFLVKSNSSSNSYTNKISKPVYSDELKIFRLKDSISIGFAYYKELDLFSISIMNEYPEVEIIFINNKEGLKLFFHDLFYLEDKSMESFKTLAIVSSLKRDFLKKASQEIENLKTEKSHLNNELEIYSSKINKLNEELRNSSKYLELMQKHERLKQELNEVILDLFNLEKNFNLENVYIFDKLNYIKSAQHKHRNTDSYINQYSYIESHLSKELI